MNVELEKEKGTLYNQSLTVYRTHIINVEKTVLDQNHTFEKYKINSLSQQNSEKLVIEEITHRLQLDRNHIDLDIKV